MWHMIDAEDQETVRARLESAIKDRHPVTLSFFEQLRDERNDPVYFEPDRLIGVRDRRPVLVKTTRTVEPYEIAQSKRGDWYVRVMDRKPRISGTYGYDVRTIRLHRILRTRKGLLFTVRRGDTYRIPNPWLKGGPLAT